MSPLQVNVDQIHLNLLCYILLQLINLFLLKKLIDITDLANKKIVTYSKYLPNNEDAFFNGYKEGDIYEIGCWINESTKVRIK